MLGMNIMITIPSATKNSAKPNTRFIFVPAFSSFTINICQKPTSIPDFPENLLPELAGYLKEHGIEKLYCHQTEMFEKVTSGKNVVITTSTASGKTLSFLLPVLQDILKICIICFPKVVSMNRNT